MTSNRVDALSRFERRLNDALWTALIIAFVYAFVQHVMLADIPEFFSFGAELGDLFYDLAIAYIGAFIFYVLVVQLPLQRDRTNAYAHLAPLFSRVMGEAKGLMHSLNAAAHVERTRENSLANVRDISTKLKPGDRADLIVGRSADGAFVWGTVMDVLRFHISRARQVNGEILNFATFLDSDVLRNLAGIEQCSLFTFFDAVDGRFNNENMSVFADSIFDYLYLVDQFNQYRSEFVPKIGAWPGQVDPSVRESGVIPLQSEMNT